MCTLFRRIQPCVCINSLDTGQLEATPRRSMLNACADCGHCGLVGRAATFVGGDMGSISTCCAHDRPLSQVGSRRKRCSGQFGQDGMGSIPATPSTKHASCFLPSSMPASIEILIKLIVCCALEVWQWTFGSRARTVWLLNKSAGQPQFGH